MDIYEKFFGCALNQTGQKWVLFKQGVALANNGLSVISGYVMTTQHREWLVVETNLNIRFFDDTSFFYRWL